jgi:hypothetical protein
MEEELIVCAGVVGPVYALVYERCEREGSLPLVFLVGIGMQRPIESAVVHRAAMCSCASDYFCRSLLEIVRSRPALRHYCRFAVGKDLQESLKCLDLLFRAC